MKMEMNDLTDRLIGTICGAVAGATAVFSYASIQGTLSVQDKLGFVPANSTDIDAVIQALTNSGPLIFGACLAGGFIVDVARNLYDAYSKRKVGEK